MAAHRASHDPVDPASQGLGLLQRVQPGVDDDKNLLHDIIHRIATDTEPSHRRPDEVKVLLVDGFELGHV
jgi:hypothetical protein